MRAIVVCAVLWLAAQFGFAQTAGPASLESLNFLLGVWTPEDWGHQAETTEFHWVERQGHALLVGRHWEGDESGCPWCVTQAAMVSYYDLASNQVRVRFADKTQRVDFALASARERFAQFLTDEQSSPARRLTFSLLPEEVLLVTLEEMQSDRESAFSTVARWTFHRRSLLLWPRLKWP
jgi:hypothetical protein